MPTDVSFELLEDVLSPDEVDDVSNFTRAFAQVLRYFSSADIHTLS